MLWPALRRLACVTRRAGARDRFVRAGNEREQLLRASGLITFVVELDGMVVSEHVKLRCYHAQAGVRRWQISKARQIVEDDRCAGLWKLGIAINDGAALRRLLRWRGWWWGRLRLRYPGLLRNVAHSPQA